jgi:hypothetical protein
VGLDVCAAAPIVAIEAAATNPAQKVRFMVLSSSWFIE